MAQKFCVMTVGRSGSTALMNYLEQFDDIAMPCKDIDCVDNELLHPDFVAKYQEEYAQLTGTEVTKPKELVAAFFNQHEDTAYAGFKSMPNRHENILRFMANPSIKIIALWRDDVTSTVASFLKANDTGSWRRDGANEKDTKWRFSVAQHSKIALLNLQYTISANAILKNAPNAIKLSYEQLCDTAFSHAELNAFFGREVKIANPKPPTSAETYVENWAEFKAFIDGNIEKIMLEVKEKIEKAKEKPSTPKNNKDTTEGKTLPNKVESKSELQELSDIMPQLASALSVIEGYANKAHLRKADFAEIQSLCLFVGYPRSGHSIVGALLDAHPEMTIAQELDITRCINAGMNRNTIYHLLSENSRIFTEQGKKWNTYNYYVPNQHQGKTQKPKVIGDKKGGSLTASIIKYPNILTRVVNTFQVPIKLIHVVRNPFDNIATFSKKHHLSLDDAAVRYFNLAKLNDELKKKINAPVPSEAKTDDSKFGQLPKSNIEMIEITHEDFVANPKAVMQKLVHYFGLTATEDYLQDCASIVSKKPNQSRHSVHWTEAQKAKVLRTMQQFSFLKHYQFDEAK